MRREIRPIGALAEQSDPVLPDHVPKEPAYGPIRRSPLILYIYRVPGKRDLFLTQHKILDNRPTSYDVNNCIYYIRYDGCMDDKRATTARPATPLQRPAPLRGCDADDTWRHEWQNISQQDLRSRGLEGLNGVRMAMVAVDTLRSNIKTVAILQDPKIFAQHDAHGGLAFPPSPMFIDILSEAYEAFGVDIAYSEGKAFTRCLSRPERRNAAFEFASPWKGVVSLEPHTQFKDNFRGFHRPYHGHAVDARLACELRPNFSSQGRRKSPTMMPTDATMGHWRSPSLPLDEVDSEAGLSRLAKIRARSSQLTESTRDSVSFLMSTRALRKGGQRPAHYFSLAQEPLGGGHGGDEAKIGKLIIHGEGQEFVDCIVAANVLLFNRLYERAMPWLHAG